MTVFRMKSFFRTGCKDKNISAIIPSSVGSQTEHHDSEELIGFLQWPRRLGR